MTKGATRFNNVCHTLYDNNTPFFRANNTHLSCKLCGCDLYAAYCEEQLHCVKCPSCGTTMLVKASGPDEAALTLSAMKEGTT